MNRRNMRDVRVLAALERPSWAGISARIAASGVPTNDGTALEEKTPRAALKDLQSQIAEARQERPSLEAAKQEARQAWIDAGMPSDDSPEFKATEAAVAAHGSLLDNIEALESKEKLLLKSLGESSGARPGHDGPAKPGNPNAEEWDSSKLFADDELVKELKTIAESQGRHLGGIELGQVVSRDTLAAEITGSEDMRRGPWLGILPQLRRRLRIVDLLPVATMEANTLPYTKESGSFTSAKTVKEGEAKPEAAPAFTDAEAKAQTIAVYQKIRKQVLADVAAMRGIIDSRLRYMVDRKLEEEILAGKGSDPEIEGILHTSGLGVIKYNASSNESGAYVAEQVLRAITTVFLADAEADGIVMAPTDWQAALLAKALYEASAGVKGGSGEFVGGGPFQSTPTQLWGLPIVVSPSMKENETLVGAFGLGAGLFIREGVNVLMSDSDQDDFIKNKITLLGEMRAALAVYRPAAFTKVWLTKAAEEAGN